jgi:hypothetical protein
MRREEERWYRARLLGDYRTLGKERGEQLGDEWGTFAGFVAMFGTGIVIALRDSWVWKVLGCLSVPTLGLAVFWVVCYLVRGVAQGFGMAIGAFIDLFLRDTLRARLLQRLRPLVEAGDTDAVAILAEYAATEQKPDLAQTALQSLRSVRHQRAIHQVCQVWLDLRKRGEAYPAQVLESLIREQRWVASQPTDLRVYTALLNEVDDAVNLARPEVVRVLLQICHADDPVLSPRAMRLLERLKEPAAVDALCDAFIERDDALARSLILQHDYLPSDATRQALVLFLTEQFDRYEALDPDHALLSAAYLAAPPTLQQRLLEHARRTGRADLMRLLTGGDLRKRARDLTEREWHTVLEMLTRQQRWSDLWRLALHAPPRWAWQLLQRLAVVRWDARALPEEEQRLFETLATYAMRLKPPTQLPLHADMLTEWRTLALQGEAQVRAIDFSHDGKWLIVGRWNRIEVYELNSGRCVRIAKIPDRLRSLCANPVHPLLVAAYAKHLHFFTLPELHLRQRAEAVAVNDLRFHPQGHRLLCRRHQRVLEVWELAGQWQRVSEIRPRLVYDCALGTGSRVLVALDGGVAVWSSRSAYASVELSGGTGERIAGVGVKVGEYERYILHNRYAQALAVAESPDGGFCVAVGFRDGAVQLHTFQGNLRRVGKEVRLQPLEGAVLHLQWAAGGQVLLGASAGEIALWRPPEPTPVQRITLNAHGAIAPLPTSPVHGGGAEPPSPHARRVGVRAEAPSPRAGRVGVGAAPRLTPSGDVLGIATPHTVRLWATPLRRLLETPTAHLAGRDLEWLEDRPRNDGDLGAWVEFIRLLTQHHIRYDIDLEFDLPVFSVGEYDIEIEVEAP